MINRPTQSDHTGGDAGEVPSSHSGPAMRPSETSELLSRHPRPGDACR